MGAYGFAEPIKPDPVTKQLVTKSLDTKTTDDYLLDMARSANINVIADATGFSPAPSVKPYPATSGAIAGQKGEDKQNWSPFLINVMGDFVAQEKLSVLRTDARTFLFWSEPDARQLLALQTALTQADQEARFAEAIAAAKAEGTPEVKGGLSDEQLIPLLRDYLKNEQGWSGSVAERTDKVDIRVRFEALPPALRALVLLDLRQRLIGRFVFQKSPVADATLEHLRIEKAGDTTTLTTEFWKKGDDGQKEHPKGLLAAWSAGTPPVVDAAIVKPDAPATSLATADTLDNAYRGISDEGSVPELEADATLSKVVSLDVKRLPLHDLFAELERQSGIHFTEAQDAPTSGLVTAYVKNLPLSKLLGLLSRVYGVGWNKGEGTTYTVRGNDQGELHLKLLQIGDPARYRFRYMFYNSADREDERKAVAQAIVTEAGAEALGRPEGVTVSTLSEPLQKRVHQVLEDPALDWEPAAIYQTNRLISEQLAKKGLVLRFGVTVNKTYRSPFHGFDVQESPDTLRFNLQTDDGQLVLPVFDSFATYMVQPGEQTARTPSHRR